MSGRGWNDRGNRGYRGWWRGRGNYRGYGRGQYRGNGGRSNIVTNAVDKSYVEKSNDKELIQSTLYDQQTPYAAWKLYFPDQLYSESSPVTIRVKVFQEFFNKCRHLYTTNVVLTSGYFAVDFKALLSDSVVSDGIPEIANETRQTPDIILNSLGLAFHQILTDESRSSDVHSSSCDVPKLHCRLLNFDPVTPLKLLRANYYGKFVTVKGTVVRVSCIKPLCVTMAYECMHCRHVQGVSWTDGKCRMPTSCPVGECRSRTFTPRRSHSLTETIDWQTVRLQEIFNDDLREAGRIPRTVDCELTRDLVDTCVPGDMVTVCGIVKVTNADEGSHVRRQKDKCVFLLYVDANSLTNSKGPTNVASSGMVAALGGGVVMEFTVKELYAIEEIHSEVSLLRLITGSLCPTIYGHELVKAGLALGLFGGTHKFLDDKNRIPVRGDPHVLIVGDPGLGKSQMLQAVANIAPRAVYVCANTTTTSGLTVTLCKDGSGSDHALEAGALVLADQGCCCIDEFDKMGNQHQALLEAMEQQSISIAKAGIVCSLPARTSIIAAANPVAGHYNKAKTVSENLRMGSALLSRFDLVFILLDKPDEDIDCMLSEHVMALHAGKTRSLDSSTSTSHQLTAEELEEKRIYELEKPLSERLRVTRTDAFDPLPPQLLRKYIGYARKYVHPKISPAAAAMLQQFYLDLRKNHQTADSTPITTRQLESLIRLTEARARIELREEATEQDTRDVIEIMKYSMIDTYSDDFGLLDFRRSQHGSGMSSRSQANKFITVLQRLSKKNCNSLFTGQELRQIAKDAGIAVRDFEVFLASLNDQGYLLKKGPRVFQLQVTEY